MRPHQPRRELVHRCVRAAARVGPHHPAGDDKTAASCCHRAWSPIEVLASPRNQHTRQVTPRRPPFCCMHIQERGEPRKAFHGSVMCSVCAVLVFPESLIRDNREANNEERGPNIDAQSSPQGETPDHAAPHRSGDHALPTKQEALTTQPESCSSTVTRATALKPVAWCPYLSLLSSPARRLSKRTAT